MENSTINGVSSESDFSALRAFSEASKYGSVCDWANTIDPLRREAPSNLSIEKVRQVDHVQCFNKHSAPLFRPSTEKNLFVFMHMNHTGGESFMRAICNAIAPQCSLVTPDPKSEENVTCKFLVQLKKSPDCIFVADHHLVAPETIDGRVLRRFTILRHPVTRLLSAYFNFVLKRHIDLPVIPKSIRENRGLEFFLDEIADTGRWPGGLEPSAYFSKTTLADGTHRHIVESSADFGEIRRSIERRFEFIGINEMYDESLFLVSIMMGLKRLPFWKIYQNSMRPRLTHMRTAIIAKAERLVADDLAIYEWARNDFHAKYRNAIEYFDQHIGGLREPGDSAEEGNRRIKDHLNSAFGVQPGDYGSADHGLQ